ncbi:hypothetical protein [Paraburkholderia youngii]|uniref:hypothetical protein n=1 Tax=Paraburkholderia youngii TaxID=2782701 RepID=UPI001592AAEE|nr:hypothetical protein [Paraburkholderia youngii]NUX55936.1 hypothetical protein [Paraburkholderia youngii]
MSINNGIKRTVAMSRNRVEAKVAAERADKDARLEHKRVADDFANRWAHWSRTRRLLAPTVKSGVLARLTSPGGAWCEPDAVMDSEMPFFNMAVHALCDEPNHASEAVCFLGIYWYTTCIKALAREQGCARGTVYNRARAFSKRAKLLSRTIRNVHESMVPPECSNSVERNSSCER